ncbi:MAG: hypothetical protein JOZ57_10200 [Abitibacteriaceae bacterium]|nr:hypothetical protein [Abditibacteriaceae bacterium]
MERLIDLVNHLPAGTRLSTTPEFERATKRKLTDASILIACGLVIDAGYQDKEAEFSRDLDTILIYAGGRWVPWPAFTLKREA